MDASGILEHQPFGLKTKTNLTKFEGGITMNPRNPFKLVFFVFPTLFLAGMISVSMAGPSPDIARLSMSPQRTGAGIVPGSGQLSGPGIPLWSSVSKPGSITAREKFKNIQLPLIQNQGQIANPHVHYYAYTPEGAVWITQKSIVYGFQKASDRNDVKETGHRAQGWILREIPKGFYPKILPEGTDPSLTQISFFRGEPKQWRTQVPAFHTVRFGEVFEGIDLSLKMNRGRVEKIFTVAPNAEPHDIAMVVEGSDGLSINAAGELEVQTGLGLVKMTAPQAFQSIGGKDVPVTVAYRLDGGQRTYGFSVGEYQKDRPLIIDPMLASTYIGSQCDDVMTDLALDASGNVFVTGYSSSSAYCENDFPVTSGAYQTTLRGGEEVVVCKFSPDLTTLLAATYLGSNGHDRGHAIAVDASGNVLVAGSAGGKDFPTTEGAYETAPQGADAFVSKFDNALSSLLASTIFTTCNAYYYTNFSCMALDSSGNVYVAGNSSWNFCDVFPPDAYDTDVDGSGDGIIVKFDNNLTTMLAGTALGGTSADYINAIALDSAGNIFVAGRPRGADFPTTPGAYMPDKPGTSEAVFIAKLNPGMTDLSASTFYGGESDDYGTYVFDMLIDASDNVLITGETQSENLPMTAYAYDTTFNGGWRDGYVAKFNNNLSTLLAGTYLGAGDHDTANGIALDSAGNVYLGGYTASRNFPVTVGADDTTHSYPNYDHRMDAFVSKFDSSLQSLSYSTFVGGVKNDYINNILVDSSTNIWIAGFTYGDFPVTQDAYDTTYQNAADGFVSKMTEPKNLAVDVIGNRRITPGERGSFELKYRNGMEVAAENVIITFDIPLETAYISSSDNGLYRTDLDIQQVFWRLGNVAPDSAGSVSVTVEVPFGLPDGKLHFFANIAASNYENSNIDVTEYLNLNIVEIVSQKDLSQSEISNLLTSNKKVKDLENMLGEQGYFFYNTGIRRDLSNGDSMLTLFFLAPSTFSPTLLTFDGNKAFAEVFNNGEYSLFDTDGGYTTHTSDGTFESWGTWAETRSLRTAHCQVNCTINNVPGWFTGLINGKLNDLMTIPSCYLCRASKGTAIDDCAKCADMAAQKYKEIPGVSWVIDVAKCLKDCKDNPNLHICTEDKLECGTSIIGWLGGFGTGSVV